MLDRIQSALFTLYKPDDQKGCFLSGFDGAKKLVVSGGVVVSDKSLRDTVVEVYKKTIEPALKNIQFVTIDVVVDTVSFPSAEDVLHLDPKEYGFVVEDLDDEKTAVILPNIAGVNDAKQVLYDLKKKYGIHGKAAISGFKTERLVVAK